jgi:hypothetical protein
VKSSISSQVSSVTNLSSPSLSGIGKQGVPGVNFNQTLEKVRTAITEGNAPKVDSFIQLQSIQKQILQGKGITFQDLIYYQVVAGQFNIKLEMLSKAADGLLGTIRKLQNNQ